MPRMQHHVGIDIFQQNDGNFTLGRQKVQVVTVYRLNSCTSGLSKRHTFMCDVKH
jgi:hypothetical protein